MFAVGIGDHINKTELRGIASSNDNVLTVKTFDQLAAELGDLIKMVCPSKYDGNWPMPWHVTQYLTNEITL